MKKELSFLERLQSADEDTKTHWMVGVTVLVMFAVVYLWFGYFNGIISGTSAAAPVAQADVPNGGFTFWQTMQRGAALTYTFFEDKLHGLGNILQTPRDIIIKPPQ